MSQRPYPDSGQCSSQPHNKYGAYLRQWPMWCDFLIIKPTRCTIFSNLFWNETLHVSDCSSVHHQEFFTVHTAIVYIIQVCWQLASRIKMEMQFNPDPARKLSAYLYDIYHCCVYSEKLLMMDRGTVRNM